MDENNVVNAIPPMETEVLKAAFASVGIECPEEAIMKFRRYYELLIMRNRVMNLTRITEPEEVAKKHFADSLLGLRFIPEGAHVIDVGSGAGFPGVPAAIMRPDIKLTLVDSLSKRVGFLKDVSDALGLNARCIHARAEDAARDDALRGHFDIALSRAVAPMNVLAELTVPFLKLGGVSLMYKGPGTGEELEAARGAFEKLKCSACVERTDSPWGARNIVLVRKDGRTPPAYPRKAGTVEKKPLV